MVPIYLGKLGHNLVIPAKREFALLVYNLFNNSIAFLLTFNVSVGFHGVVIAPFFILEGVAHHALEILENLGILYLFSASEMSLLCCDMTAFSILES